MLADKILKRLLQLINHHCSLNLSQFTIFFLSYFREKRNESNHDRRKSRAQNYSKSFWTRTVDPISNAGLKTVRRTFGESKKITCIVFRGPIQQTWDRPFSLRPWLLVRAAISRIKRRRTTARRWGTARWPFRWWWCRAVSGGWSSGPDCWPAETWNREQGMSNYHEFTE